ncbi:cation:proton antiporter [Anaerobacillus sp. MEB173]|uniref:cation:proton antiporter n=1 Tax=Anaerobacillus sp. MEB173 TaxID=3383345 RepID=UPI003F91A495
MTELPITNPVLIFALSMVLFLFAPIIMNRCKVPGIIGLILAGIVVGPNGAGILERDSTIVLLGTVGLLYIIFIAGLEIDIDGFKKYQKRSILFGGLSFTLPFLLGLCLGIVIDLSLTAAILLGSVLGSHTLLAYPIASRLGVSKNKAVTTAVGGLIMTDTFALLTLAIIAGSVSGDLTVMFFVKLLSLLLLFMIVVFVFVPVVSKWFFRNVSSEGSTEFVFVMSVLFVCAFMAIAIGVEPIIGAFLAGLSLNRLILQNGPLMNRIKFIGNTIFIPFFFLSVGMLMDLRVLFGDTVALMIATSMIALVIAGKAIAAWITCKLFHYKHAENWMIFGLTIPQAAATLAATYVGFELGLFNKAIVNGVILMIFVTCIIGPYIVEKYGRKLIVTEEQKEYVQHVHGSQRLLIPLANPSSMEPLLDLAFIIRDKRSTEPIFPLKVVTGYGKTAQLQLIEAENLLNKTVVYASGAEVPVQVMTRLDQNIAKGITSAIFDTRITTILFGWNGYITKPQRIFGSVLDQTLEHTNQNVLVAKLVHPLNTITRIVLLLPPLIKYKESFYEAIEMAGKVSDHLGASLHCLVIKGDVESYRKTLANVNLPFATTFEEVNSWNDLVTNHMDNIHKSDLVVLISARQGRIAWHPKLEMIPHQLAKHNLLSFLIIYPHETEVDLRGSRGIELPSYIMPSKEFD